MHKVFFFTSGIFVSLSLSYDAFGTKRFGHNELGIMRCLGVTSCPPSRTPYTHDVRIFYISSLSNLFDILEQCWYQRCVTSIEIGGDVLALGIRFI